MATFLPDIVWLKLDHDAVIQQPRQQERIVHPCLLWQPDGIALRRTFHLADPQSAIDPDLAEAKSHDPKGEEFSLMGGRVESLNTHITRTVLSSFKPPESTTTTSFARTANTPSADVTNIPEVADEPGKPTQVTATQYIGRNHLWDVYRAKVSNSSDQRHVILQLSVAQHFPKECPRIRPAYCDTIERFSFTQAKKGVQREAWFYQKYAPSLNEFKDTVPNYNGTFHARYPCREGSWIMIDLYAMILDDPGEVLGNGWQSIHDDSISDDIWRKVYESYDLLHSHQIIHNTELVALNIFYDKKSRKVRICNFFDVLVLASDNYEPGEEAEIQAKMFLRGEKARIESFKRIIALPRIQ
ncbi:hypothetical protein V865_002879 [Kwoniella europaea PYCC6329]|uniref:Protein kinase domain-containing protein n=1 Tax=Kwoniella europaea PYCC6329 TaxID=1423913 RepID=A0AAX4KHB5_9TREE